MAGENVMWATKQLGHTDSTFTARTYSRWIDRDAPESGMLPVAKWQRSSIDWWLNGGDWLPSI
jgi:integrase